MTDLFDILPPDETPPAAESGGPDSPGAAEKAPAGKAGEAADGTSGEIPEEAAEYDFGDRYIWDEKSRRLYEVVEKKPLPLGRILGLCFCVVLLAASIAPPILSRRGFLPAGLSGWDSILSRERPRAEDEGESLPAGGETPPPAEWEPAYTPSDILIDGRAEATLASAEAAQELLEDVLAYFDGLVAAAGERTAEFETPAETVPRPDAAPDEIQSQEQAFAFLTSADTPVRVRTTVVNRESRTLPFDTETRPDDRLLEGTRIVLSQGREGSVTKVTSDVYINGRRSSSRSLARSETVKPQDRRILQGSRKLRPKADSPGGREGEMGRKPEGLSFAPPADGGIILNYGQVRGVLHLGLDYAPSTPRVLASEGGVVASLLERGGCGLTMEIDHGGGFVTRYALLGDTYVSPGDRVEKGQVIASPGPDESGRGILHFEIRVDGIAYNPRYYLK